MSDHRLKVLRLVAVIIGSSRTGASEQKYWFQRGLFRGWCWAPCFLYTTIRRILNAGLYFAQTQTLLAESTQAYFNRKEYGVRPPLSDTWP